MTRVLLVDDEPDMRLLLRMTLERVGYEVSEAASGEDALAGLEKLRPDLVLLDLNLPGMSGFGVMEVMRRSGTSPATPVVLLTADPSPDLPERAKAAGCFDCISKMEAPARLEDAIRRATAAAPTGGGR